MKTMLQKIVTPLFFVILINGSLSEFTMGCRLPLQEDADKQESTPETSQRISSEEQLNKLLEKFNETWNDSESTARDKRRIRSATTKALIELEKNAATPEQSIKILRWIQKHNQKNRKGRNAAALILDKHFDRPGIGDCMNLDTPFEDLLRVLESNQDPETRAIAEFLQAQHYSVEDEARETIFLALLANHADVIYQGESLEGQIKPLLQAMQFSIGKLAPEITGPDIDGVKFSLSDYRGKIVVLDFWGDW